MGAAAKSAPRRAGLQPLDLDRPAAAVDGLRRDGARRERCVERAARREVRNVFRLIESREQVVGVGAVAR